MDLFAADDAVLLSTQTSVSTCGKPRSAKMFWNCITERTKTIHLSNLTRYIQTQFHRAPAEAAMHDFSDVFMVERIVEGVKGNEVKGPVSALKFKVSWVGFPGEDTIEPWKAVRKLEVFKDFIENHASKGYRDLGKKLSKEQESESGGEAGRVGAGLVHPPNVE